MANNFITMCCTHGRGMNAFVRQELKAIGVNLDFIHQSDPASCKEVTTDLEGKIFFSVPLSQDCKQFLSLKTVERVFIVAFQTTNPGLSEDELITHISERVDLIKVALKTWTQMFRYPLKPQKSHTRTFLNNRKRKISGEHATASSSDSNHTTESTAITGTRSEAESDILTEASDTAAVVTSSVRVSVKVTGSYRSVISQDRLRSAVCDRVTEAIPGYTILQTGQSDTTLNIIYSDELLLFGVPISTEPLSTRSYIKSHGLRPTTCAAMIQLADISIGDVVLDPFCGAATLLIESVHQQPDALFVGIDDKSVQLERALLNVQYYSDFIHCSTRTTDHTKLAIVENDQTSSTMDTSGWRAGPVQVMTGNAAKLPFQDGSVDVILTDMPFGKKHRVKQVHDLYIQCCMQVYRVLKPGGRAVILTSKALLSHLKSAAVTVGFSVVSEHFVTLGRTEAFIVKLRKPP